MVPRRRQAIAGTGQAAGRRTGAVSRMMPRFIPPLLAGLLLLAMAALTWQARQQVSQAQQQMREAEAREQAVIQQFMRRQQAVAELDAQHLQELSDARDHIARLERDVADGRQRLHLHARCQPVPATTPTASMDAATGARLDYTAQRDYFTLRRRIETARQQIAGLQDYVRQVCLMNDR